MNEASPFAALLSIAEQKDDAGQTLCVMEPGEASFARQGVMHGGAVAALLQSACKSAVKDALVQKFGAADAALSSVSITVDYLAPGRMITSYAAGKIVKLGSRVAHVNAKAWTDDADRPFAVAKMIVGIGR